MIQTFPSFCMITKIFCFQNRVEPRHRLDKLKTWETMEAATGVVL